jgi:hypothetical protein
MRRLSLAVDWLFFDGWWILWPMTVLVFFYIGTLLGGL